MTSATKLTTRADTKFANLIDAVDEAQARVLSAQRRIKSIEEQMRHLGDHEDDEPRRRDLQDEIERVTVRRDRAQGEFANLSRVVTAIRTYLSGLPASAELIDYVANPLAGEIFDSETADQGVATCQEEISKLKVERNAVIYSVPPLHEMYLAAHAHVQHLAARGRPSVLSSGGKLVVRHDSDNSFGGRGNSREDALAVFAWLMPEAMVAKLHEQIDAQRELETKRGVLEMSPAEKESALSRIDREIMRYERMEESYVEVGESYGLRIQRRDDASPLAILGLELSRRQRSAA